MSFPNKQRHPLRRLYSKQIIIEHLFAFRNKQRQVIYSKICCLCYMGERRIERIKKSKVYILLFLVLFMANPTENLALYNPELVRKSEEHTSELQSQFHL